MGEELRLEALGFRFSLKLNNSYSFLLNGNFLRPLPLTLKLCFNT